MPGRADRHRWDAEGSNEDVGQSVGSLLESAGAKEGVGEHSGRGGRHEPAEAGVPRRTSDHLLEPRLVLNLSFNLVSTSRTFTTQQVHGENRRADAFVQPDGAEAAGGERSRRSVEQREDRLRAVLVGQSAPPHGLNVAVHAVEADPTVQSAAEGAADGSNISESSVS